LELNQMETSEASKSRTRNRDRCESTPNLEEIFDSVGEGTQDNAMTPL
jgi:hypothetical protein